MAEKAKKPNIFARIARYFKDVRGELKKVVWPTRKQLLNNTLVVLTFVALSAVLIGLLDAGFHLLIDLLLNNL